MTKLRGTDATIMTPEQAKVAEHDWLVIREGREQVDAVCRCAAIAQKYLTEVRQERNHLIALAVRAGEAAQVARLCGLSRQQVYTIAAETPLPNQSKEKE